MKKTMSLLLVLLLLVSMMSACTSKPAEPSAAEAPAASTETVKAEETVPAEKKDTIRVAMNGDMTTLSGINGKAQGFSPAFHIFDVLCALTPDMSLRPNLATEWEQIDDYTWRFKLREGVKFHDGKEFTSADAAYSINYIANMTPAYAIKGQWATSWPPEGIVVDEYTFDIVTPQPNLKIAELLNRCPMIPEGCMEENPDFFKTPVGTGPYKFVAWEAGVSVTLVANEDYWDGKPAVENLIFYAVADGEARNMGLKTGEYDFVTGVGYDVAEELKAEGGKYGMTLDEIESTGHSYFFYNHNSANKFVQDVNFRKALHYAIDAAGIAEAILYGYATPSLGISPQNVGGATNSGGYPAQDIDKAKELLAACGYNGEEISVYLQGSTFTNVLEVTEIIVSMLQEAGVNAVIYEIDGSQWDDIKAGDTWDIAANNLGGTYTGDSELYYTQSMVKQFWAIPEADALVASLYLPGITAEQREATLKELMQFCWDQAPFLWCVDQKLLCARDPQLKGVEVLPMGIYRFTYAYYE